MSDKPKEEPKEEQVTVISENPYITKLIVKPKPEETIYDKE
jgi:hypothetical protein